jgi:mRNA interferase MazF
MSKVQFKKGEIYYVDLEGTKGSEVKKVRPCLIASNDLGNRYAPTLIICPITHRPNKNQPTQVHLQGYMFEEATKKIDGMVLTEQIRTVDKSRIHSPKLAKLTDEAVMMIDQAILISMGISARATA